MTAHKATIRGIAAHKAEQHVQSANELTAVRAELDALKLKASGEASRRRVLESEARACVARPLRSLS